MQSLLLTALGLLLIKPSTATGRTPPTAGATWHIDIATDFTQISNLATDPAMNHNVAVYDVDMWLVNAAVISALHAKGIYVICYVDIGTNETWRPDAGNFAGSPIGGPVYTGDGNSVWPNESWFDIADPLDPILKSGYTERLQRAAALGCDGIDPDNTDGYDNVTGFTLKEGDTNALFTKFLIPTAKSLGMNIGLKNSVDMVDNASPAYNFASITDWVVIEQCGEIAAECDRYQPYIKAGKPAFEIEYPADEGATIPTNPSQLDASVANQLCNDTVDGTKPGNKGFSVVLKDMNLDSWTYNCWEH